MIVLYLLLSVALIVLLTIRWKVHPFLALLLVALLYGFAAGMPATEIAAAINTGFGDTLGKIGLVIVLGVLIGAFLENSGGAYALAEKVLQVIGRKRVTGAMGVMGYIVSIPVFADSGFLLLSALNKSLAQKAGLGLAGPATALALGLLATHTMVPPTPGPVAAAGILGADIGLVLAVGLLVSAAATGAGILFALFYAGRSRVDPSAGGSEEQIAAHLPETPGAFKSCLPIVLPIALIVLKSVATARGGGLPVFAFLGEPVIALLIGLSLALFLPRKFDLDMLSVGGWAGTAMRDAAGILLITGAGGVFGKVLQQSGIATLLGGVLSGINLGLWLPFLLAAAIKTAQGSSTVAMITASSILLPLLPALGFETGMEKALVAVAVGAGSMVVSHANDSFFWVVTQMSGMDVRGGYRFISLGSAVSGLAAMLFLSLGYWLLG